MATRPGFEPGSRLGHSIRNLQYDNDDALMYAEPEEHDNTYNLDDEYELPF